MKLSAQKNLIIEVVGNVGSGKTTLARKLSKLLDAQYIDIDPYIENPFLSLYVKEKKRWAFTTALHFSYMRAQIIPKVNKLLPPSVLDHGFESGLFMYPWSSYKLGEMSKEEWNLLRLLHSQLMMGLPKIDVSIFLNMSSKSIMQRLKNRGREHEKFYTKKYVEQLQKGLDEYKKKLIKGNSRVTILELFEDKKKLKVHGKGNSQLEKLFLQNLYIK